MLCVERGKRLTFIGGNYNPTSRHSVADSTSVERLKPSIRLNKTLFLVSMSISNIYFVLFCRCQSI